MTDGWVFQAATTTGTFEDELTKATERKITWRLVGAADAEFKINGRIAQAAGLNQYLTDLYVHWNKKPMFRGRLGRRGRTITDKAHSVTWTANDYRYLISKRAIWEGGVGYDDTDTAEQLYQLILRSQAQTGGNFGITRGHIEHTGATPSNLWAATKSIGDAASDLSKIWPGFDWEISPDLELNIWKGPGRGHLQDLVLDYPGTVSNADELSDPSQYANTFLEKGKTGLDVAVASAPDLASRPEGRWEAWDNNPDLASQAAVDGTATKKLDELATVIPSWTLTPKPGVWNPDLLWLGDKARYVIKDGTCTVDEVERVVEISVAIDEKNRVKPTITFGTLRADLVRMVRGLPGRIDRINNR